MRPKAERGSVVVETTIVVTGLFLVLLLVVAGGRITRARNDVYGAAADGARAASLRATPAQARADANASVRRALAERGVTCRRLDVAADTAGLRAGGRVAVSVSCTVSLSDLTGLGLPGSRTVSASAVEPVDSYRGD